VDSDEVSCARTAALLRSVRHEAITYARAGDLLADEGRRPWNCVVTELRLADMPGLELHARLARHDPAAPVVFFTAFATVEMAVRALKGGAFDFLEKSACPDLLLDAVYRAACESRRHRERASSLSVVNTRLSTLTPRERKVIELVATGCTTKEIARKLELSQGTISIHRYKAMHKLGARSAAQVGPLLQDADPDAVKARVVSPTR
jgi:RNA polymerase sigma factor (sigma-70 family)